VTAPVSAVPALAVPALTGPGTTGVTATEVTRVWAPPPGFWPGLLDGVAEAVVAIDTEGVVRSANNIAHRLLPIEAGKVVDGSSSLAEALRGDTMAFEIDHDEHRLHGRRVAVGGLTVWYIRDLTEQTMRVDALLAERWRSAFLAEASRRLGGSLHRDRVASTAAMLAVPALGDCAVVLLPGQRRRIDWYRYSSGAGQEHDPHTGTIDAHDLAVGSPLADALGGLPVPEDPRLAEEVRWLLPEDFGSPGSAMIMTLPGHGEPAGALIVVRDAGRAGFESVEQHLIRQFSARAGTAIAAATLYSEQVQTADVLQESLIPPALPEVDGLALGATYRAAKERLRIGGDFYDIFAGPDKGWTFVLGDVCGKGVEAAVHTGQVRQTLHALRLLESEPRRLLELLNQAVFSHPNPQLATLVIGSVEPQAGGSVLIRAASGGHPAPMVLRADGKVEEFEARGPAVGVIPGAAFGEVTIRLAPGDTFIVYSDGVTEARGGPSGSEFYGTDRLAALLSSYAGAPAAAIAQRIEQASTEWISNREHDDIAVLTIQAKPRIPGKRHLTRVPRQ
jgi:serine phosphatase RsbU (regulator of sigma subunit)